MFHFFAKLILFYPWRHIAGDQKRLESIIQYKYNSNKIFTPKHLKTTQITMTQKY